MAIHAATDDMRGNIVFFQSYGLSWWDRLCTRVVQQATRGPYVHCEIVYGKEADGWKTIGAMSSGIAYGHISSTDHTAYTMTTIRTVNTDEKGRVCALDEARLTYALLWADMHIGTSYGFIDNIDQGIDLVFPNNPVQLVQPNHFNCSNFVAAFLDKAGIRLPVSFTYPFNVSPNDLAEWFGLLPERKRIRL